MLDDGEDGSGVGAVKEKLVDRFVQGLPEFVGCCDRSLVCPHTLNAIIVLEAECSVHVPAYVVTLEHKVVLGSFCATAVASKEVYADFWSLCDGSVLYLYSTSYTLA